VLKVLERQGIFPERIISLQPTAPLIKSTSIEEGIQLHRTSNCDSVCSVALVLHNHPYWVKSLDVTTHRLHNFTTVDGDKYLQNQALPVCYTYTGGFYIRKRNILDKGKGKGLEQDVRGVVLSPNEALDINYPIDLEYFRYILEKIKDSQAVQNQ